MQKFSDILYVRPDLAAYKNDVIAHVEKVKNAKSYEERPTEATVSRYRSSQDCPIRLLKMQRKYLPSSNRVTEMHVKFVMLINLMISMTSLDLIRTNRTSS